MKKKNKIRIYESKFEVLPLFVALFIIGLICSSSLGSAGYAVFLFAAIASLIISVPDKFKQYRFLFLCLAAIMAGAFYGSVRIISHDYADFLKLDATQGELTGIFSGEFKRYKSGNISFKIKNATYAFDRQNARIPGLVNCIVKGSDLNPEPEQFYRLSGRFISPEPGRLPSFRADTIERSDTRTPVHQLAGKAQRAIRDGLNKVLPRQHAAMAVGFVLGDTGQISTDDRRLFRETGISHLLAVSGQHIMVMIMLIASILHWIKIPPLSRTILISAILLFYALTTSGSPSVWRALTMYLCVAAVLHTEAFSSPIRPVAIAALLLLLFEPSAIYSAAFQLSFVAVLSIIYLRHPIEFALSKLYLPEIVCRYLGVTFAANLGTMPIAAYIFGTVSTASLLVNPLILWSFAYILPAFFITAGLAIVAPSLAIYFSPGLSLFLDGVIKLLRHFNSLPGSFFYVGNLPAITIATFYALLLFSASAFNRWQLQQLYSETDRDNNKNAPAGKPRFKDERRTERLKTTTSAKSFNSLSAKNLFRDESFVRKLDLMMTGCKRRALKSHSSGPELSFPITWLSLENQNLLHQITDLNLQVLTNEPERLLQAQIYLLSLIGNEILNRLSFHLNPPPSPDDLRIKMVVRDRHLASVVLCDSILSSFLLTRATDESLILIISRVQSLFSRGRSQLESILQESCNEELINQHLALRRDLMCWCGEFIEFDVETRKKQANALRSEL